MRFSYVVHHPGARESRVADILRDRGHAVAFVCPLAGESIPDPGEIDGVVVGGGLVPMAEAPDHAWMEAEVGLARSITEANGRYLGNCLGSQILAAAFGAESGPRADGRAEFGFYPIEPTPAAGTLLDGLRCVYHAHYEGSELPPTAELLASNDTFENQAFRIGDRAFGFQFHFDARLDMIEPWFRVYAEMAARPGAQTLDHQLVEARRHEAEIQAWTERFVDHWLAA